MSKRTKTKAKTTSQDNGVVASEKPKAKPKKKYEKKVKIKLAGALSNFLVLNSVTFRARYDGNGSYTFKVRQENKTLLDDICEKLKP